MSRPTLTLAMIMKNEEENLPRLMKSVEGCFDEVIITDTGSTDSSVELAKRLGARVQSFSWINDFAAARNASFEPVKTDYVMWLDLDDELENQKGFLLFRDNIMMLADYWMATYHYTSDEKDKPVCSFVRERVFKVDKAMRWKYFLHEGVTPISPYGQIKGQFTNAWTVRHRRTQNDLVKDRSRNLNIFENKASQGVQMDPRMNFYYGKELFEFGRPIEAVTKFSMALGSKDLEQHDRVLAMQYACYALLQWGITLQNEKKADEANAKFTEALQIASQGVLLSPHRAEFHCIIGDCFIKLGRVQDALPFFSAAKSCFYTGNGPSPIFSTQEQYTAYPSNQITRIFVHMGDYERGAEEATKSFEKFASEESKLLLAGINQVKEQIYGFKKAQPCEDIVITCPPQSAYEWDGEKYKNQAMGGSETAAIEMAQWLHKLTGRSVKIFNMRETALTVDGVEYLPSAQCAEYMGKHKPWVHIAWRHNMKVTDAPTFLWCHDLYTPAGENVVNYEKMLCLTPFHKRFIMATQGVSEDKIHVTRNGLNPERFKDGPWKKNPNKIVFPSSPDRGLDRAMRVMDKVREKHPDVELHVFYGIEHLHKYGLQGLADKLKQMMNERPWVKYHGATQQDELMRHLKESAIWLHPCDFVETSCITAMEMVCAGVYPVTRRLGGLMDTLSEAEKRGMATLIDSDCVTETEFQSYIDATIKALDEKAHERVKFDAETISWKSVAEAWIQDLFPKAKPVQKALTRSKYGSDPILEAMT